MTETERELFRNLARMQNPMESLISTMRNMVASMGVAKYAESLTMLEQTEEMLRKAMNKINETYYIGG